MGRSQRRKQNGYTPGSPNALQLELAVDDIFVNKISVREAVAKYALPRTTIHCRHKKKYGPIRPVEPSPLTDNISVSGDETSDNSHVEEMLQSVRVNGVELLFNEINTTKVEEPIEDITAVNLGTVLADDSGASKEFINSLFEGDTWNGCNNLSYDGLICLQAFPSDDELQLMEQQLSECGSPLIQQIFDV